MEFDHEKLDVYKVSLEFVRFAADLVSSLKGNHRNARDQLIRSSQSIPLNIAEGNGKRSLRDRKRYLEIARGSAMECAATLDVLECIGACSKKEIMAGKALLLRIVSMLSKMTEPKEGLVKEAHGEYGENEESDYENEHEHEFLSRHQ